MKTMAGPRKIIDLDSNPQEGQGVSDEKSTYLYRGRLWRLEPVCCVLCSVTESKGPAQVALQDENDEASFVCLIHGDLEEVPFIVKRQYTLSVGEETRTGEVVQTDSILIPKSMSAVERSEWISRICKNADEQEKSAMHEDD